MPQFSTDLFVDIKLEQKPNAFWDNEPLLFADESQAINSNLRTLSSKVSRKPIDLMAHLHRIYFCYRNALIDPLYAALLDFLIILNGKGRKISSRLIHGSRSQLDPNQIALLKNALACTDRSQGNRFSLFATGIVGTTQLVEILHKEQEQHDYLALANDFIEFSQLEEAMSVLEQGLNDYPERQDMQAALLELYKSTDSRERFNQMYESIKAVNVSLSDDWKMLADFFDGKTI